MKNERFETVEDLINSDSFCECVQYQYHKAFWLEWQANNPERQALVLEAKAFLTTLTFQKETTDTAEITSAINTVWATIEKTTNSSSPSIASNAPTKFKQMTFWSRRWRIAASILFLIAASWLIGQYTATDVVTYATAYGETETLVLPDGSQVVLQANSTLKVPKNWAEQPTRNVWLEGQAFFEVTKLERETPIKFTVQTDDFKVDVLGTEFDVLNRDNHKRVVLQEGKVRMQLPDKQSIDLAPNEMVAYSSQTEKYEKAVIEATNLTAWTNDELILDETPLSEIARLFTDNYGFEVRFAATANQTQVRSTVGVLPINNVDDLIDVTEASYEVEIIKKGQLIEIQSAVGSSSR